MRALAFALFLAGFAAAQETPKEEPKVVPFKGGGKLYVKERKIELEGMAVYPLRAPIELFACSTHGKDHEAIFVVECVPQELHFALLVLGLRDKREFPDQKGPQFLGDPAKPVGDRVFIFIEWTDEKGVKHRVRAEDLLTYGPPAPKRTMPQTGWVFAGSEIYERKDPDSGQPTGESMYMANRERTLISMLHDPTAVLDNPMIAGGDDRVFHANFDALPPRGSRILMVIEVPTEEEAAAAAKLEAESDKEYVNVLAKAWENLEEVAPDKKGAEEIPEKK